MRAAGVIVVPHIGSYRTAEAALARRSSFAVDVSDSDEDYFDLLARLWAAGETFTIVEHDIAVTADALDSLDACPSDWCACPYPYVNGWIIAGLGCARFRSGLLMRHPDLMAVVAGMHDETHPRKHWCRLDAWVHNSLIERGEKRCEAHPRVEHLMRDQHASAHGCFTD